MENLEGGGSGAPNPEKWMPEGWGNEGWEGARRVGPQTAGDSQNGLREPKRALCVEFGLEPRPKFHEKTPKRGKQE